MAAQLTRPGGFGHEGAAMGRARARVVWSGADTLELFSRAPVSAVEVERLRALRAAGVKRKRPEVVVYAEEAFEIALRQGRHAALLLRSETMTVAISPDARGQRPRIVFELGALPLACLGADAAAERARAVLACLSPSQAGAPVLHVSRVDLAADVQGWAVRSADLKRFHTRVRRVREHDGTRGFTGFVFGKKALLARVYDKTAEIAETGKAWLPDRWAKSGRYRPGPPVWRIEYQLRRQALSSFARHDDRTRLDTWEQVRTAIPSLWRTLTMDWLSIRLPRTGKTRRRYAPVWNEVIEAFANRPGSGSEPSLYRVAQRTAARANEAGLDRLILREVAVRRWLSGNEDPVGRVARSVLDDAWRRIAASPRKAREVVSRRLAAFRSAEGATAPAAAGGVERGDGWAA